MEKWKDIPGWENMYAVSDHGRVKSYGRLKRILKPGISKNGYPVVVLCRGLKTKTHTIHRLVLLAFVGPAPLGYECCHYNGVRADARLTNLRYGTRSENHLDRHRHGTLPDFDGEKSPSAKLTNAKVKWIRENYTRFSSRAIGKKFGVGHTTVLSVIKNKTWRKLKC